MTAQAPVPPAASGAAKARTRRHSGRRRTEDAVDPTRVLAELVRMAFYDPAPAATAKSPEDLAALPEDVRHAVIGWEWDRAGNFSVKLVPRLPILEMLARHLGLLGEKAEEGDLAARIEAARRRARGEA